jgi:hypothetical protein
VGPAAAPLLPGGVIAIGTPPEGMLAVRLNPRLAPTM